MREQLACTLLLFTLNKHHSTIINYAKLVTESEQSWRTTALLWIVVHGTRNVKQRRTLMLLKRLRCRAGGRDSAGSEFTLRLLATIIRLSPQRDWRTNQHLETTKTVSQLEHTLTSTCEYMLTHTQWRRGNVSTFRHSPSCCYSNFNGVKRDVQHAEIFCLIYSFSSQTLLTSCADVCVHKEWVWKLPAGQNSGGNYCRIKNKTMWETKSFMRFNKEINNIW